jgi:hypothetical protein
MRLGVAAKRVGALLGVLVCGVALFLAATINSTGPHQGQDTVVAMKEIESAILISTVKHRCMPTNLATLNVAGLDSWGRPILLLVPESSPEGQYALLSLGRDGVVGGNEIDADIVVWGAMPGSVAPLPCQNTGVDSPEPR